MLATLAPWQKTLLDAAEIIKERGHCKGIFERGSDGPTCAVGAILRAAGLHWQPLDRPRDLPAAAALAKSLGVPSIYRWNDAPERTAEEVIAALQAAALT